MPYIIATAHDSAGESDGQAGRSSSARDRSGARPRHGGAQSLSVPSATGRHRAGAVGHANGPRSGPPVG
jgi:hypothetical protein